MLNQLKHFVENNIFIIEVNHLEIKMKLLSTLGWTAKVVIEAAKILGADEHIVFYGYVDDEEKERVLSALEEVKKELKNVKAVQVDPMNFHDCIMKINENIDEESVANITGGTKIMSFSLALKAALLDIPIVYVVTENGKTTVKRVPVRLSTSQRSFFRMSEEDSTAKEMLKILLNEYNGKAKMKELKMRLNRKYSTLSDAKSKLILANLIREEKVGREKILIANSVAYLFGGNAI
jgi:CRISPR-associated protein Csa3